MLPSCMGVDPKFEFPFVVGGKVKDLGEEEKMLPRILLINSPMGSEDEMIVLGDLDSYCNMEVLFSLLKGRHLDIFE